MGRYNMPPDIIREIEELKRRLRKLEGVNQLGYSSLDEDEVITFNLSAINVKDEAEFIRYVVGKQNDGTYGSKNFNGPVPNTPNVPSVVPLNSAYTVIWDGSFPAGRPNDLDHVDVHVSIVSGFEHSSASRAASFDAHGGDSITLPGTAGVPFYIVLVAVSTSETESNQTAEVSVVPLGGGSGSGDVVGPGVSVVGELATYADNSGTLLGRTSGNGIVKLSTGVAGFAIAGVDYLLPGSAGTGDTISNETSNTDGQLVVYAADADGKHIRIFDDFDGLVKIVGGEVQQAVAGVDYALPGGGGGGIAWVPTSTKTTAYTASDHQVVICDASGGTFNVTLPSPVAGYEVEVKKIDMNYIPIRVIVSGGANIDGDTEDFVEIQWTSQRYVSSSSKWYRV